MFEWLKAARLAKKPRIRFSPMGTEVKSFEDMSQRDFDAISDWLSVLQRRWNGYGYLVDTVESTAP